MITTHGILDTGVRAVKAFQAALATTAHNVTNVATEGFSRQRVDLAPTIPMPHVPGQIGTGVEAVRVTRLRLEMLDATMRLEQSHLGHWDQLQETARNLETLFGDPTNGSIGKALTEFWNGWQDLTTAPEEMGMRQVVLDRGMVLADALRDAVSRFDDLNTGLNVALGSAINDANTYTAGIATLNDIIFRAELGGNNANDLRDNRDLLVEKLAALTNVNVTVDPVNGMYDVDVNGQFLVQGINSYALTGVIDPVTNHMDAYLGAVPLGYTNGKFLGFRESYALLDSTRTDLDTLAATLINGVNTQHALGFDLLGAPGQPFFVGADAATIDLSPAIGADPRLVAASDEAPAPLPAVGSNGNALAIALLRDAVLLPTGTLNESFNNQILTLGSQSREAQQRRENYSDAVEMVREQREAVSGVNMDEELANMMSFQRAYQAAARVITAVDDMLDTIINRTGRVGL